MSDWVNEWLDAADEIGAFTEEQDAMFSEDDFDDED